MTLSRTRASSPKPVPAFPKRGEIWVVDLNPTIGAEIQKRRPAVVVSSDAVGRLPIKLVAPITGWNPAFASSYWHVFLLPDAVNGLAKESAVDALQLRGVDVQRFVQFVGRLSATKMEDVAAAIAAVIEYQ